MLSSSGAGAGGLVTVHSPRLLLPTRLGGAARGGVAAGRPGGLPPDKSHAP